MTASRLQRFCRTFSTLLDREKRAARTYCWPRRGTTIGSGEGIAASLRGGVGVSPSPVSCRKSPLPKICVHGASGLRDSCARRHSSARRRRSAALRSIGSWSCYASSSSSRSTWLKLRKGGGVGGVNQDRWARLNFARPFPSYGRGHAARGRKDAGRRSSGELRECGRPSRHASRQT